MKWFDSVTIMFVMLSASMLASSIPWDEMLINPSQARACSGPSGLANSTLFQMNSNILLKKMAQHEPLHNASYYKATEGKNSSKVYGLLQCRGDASAQNCARCTREAINQAQSCPSKSREVGVWSKWCFLHYSNENFYGVWDPESSAVSDGTEDPDVVSKGLAFMRGLVSMAPNQTLMFQTEMLDVGQNRKRSGVAQCTRDLSMFNCSKCLDAVYATHRDFIENRVSTEKPRVWSIYGKSCSMGYSDPNYNTSNNNANDGAKRTSHGGFMAGLITYGALFFVL